LQQHLKVKHNSILKELEVESVHSKYSSVQVKICKEENAIAVAEAFGQGTLDKVMPRL
jgi:hypothetical protein